MSAPQVLVRESNGKAIEKAQPDEVETSYGGEVVEFVEEGRWEVGAKVCRVVDCIAGDLLRKSVRKLGIQQGLGEVRANLLRGGSLRIKLRGTCQRLCTFIGIEPAHLKSNRVDQ